MLHSLVLGSLDLDEREPSDDGYSFAVLADGMSFGVAQGVKEIVASLLADGDLTRTTRYGNREVTFVVEIEGTDLAAVASGEMALRNEVGRANTLTWTAPDVFAAPTVFDVLDSEMAQKFDDLDELRRKRTFAVTLTCAPFARSQTLTTVPGLSTAVVPETLPVDSCDSLAGWSREADDTFVYDSTYGAVRTSNVIGVVGPPTLSLTRSAAIDVSAHPYVIVEWQFTSDIPATPAVRLYANGVELPELARVSFTLGGGLPSWFRSWFSVSPGQLGNGFTLNANGIGRGNASLAVTTVSKSNVPPGTSPRQSTRTFEVGGTERTPASIQVSPNEAVTLGFTVVHTYPEDKSGYSPPLRRWRTSGNTVSSLASLVSGFSEPINGTPVVSQVPILAVPEGEYAYVALLRSSMVGTFPVDWMVRTGDTAAYFGPTLSGTMHATFSVANTWVMFPIETLTLPPARSKAGVVEFQLSRTTVGSEVIDTDEQWIFRTGDDCALTILSSSGSFLWLDSASVDNAVPQVWQGLEGNKTDARHPGDELIAQGAHFLTPPATTVFTVSSGAPKHTMSATYYTRWHSNAVE